MQSLIKIFFIAGLALSIAACGSSKKEEKANSLKRKKTWKS